MEFHCTLNLPWVLFLLVIYDLASWIFKPEIFLPLPLLVSFPCSLEERNGLEKFSDQVEK